MKLKFKQQQYQRDATMAVVNCFGGQNKGERKEIIGRTWLFIDEIFSNKKIPRPRNRELDANKRRLRRIRTPIPRSLSF